MTIRQVNQPQSETAAPSTSQSTVELQTESQGKSGRRRSNEDITQPRQHLNKERQPLQEEEQPRENTEDEPRPDHYSTGAPTRPDTSNVAPIGKKLDMFRDCFQEACQNLDLAVMLDSLDSFSIKDNQKLILDLISVL
ncbi:hypothetical protein BJX70DRAFT_11720 [Aspergillus crustosus]